MDDYEYQWRVKVLMTRKGSPNVVLRFSGISRQYRVLEFVASLRPLRYVNSKANISDERA